MKTSKKLLIGLIAFIFLLATICIGILKYYQYPEDPTMENSSSSSIYEMEPNTATLVYFPITLILPILK